MKVRDLHLRVSVAKGEVLALLGRNGAGKSTTMKAIMGLVRPSAGHVRFEGVELADREPFEIARAGIGCVPEERRIFTELTVAEDLEVGRRPGPPLLEDGPPSASTPCSAAWQPCARARADG